jgi:hypothetical protein
MEQFEATSSWKNLRENIKFQHMHDIDNKVEEIGEEKEEKKEDRSWEKKEEEEKQKKLFHSIKTDCVGFSILLNR